MAKGKIENPFSSDVIFGYLKAIDDLSSKMLQQFGTGEKMAQTMRQAAADSLDLFQRLGGTMQDVVRVQTETTSTLQRNVLLSAEGARDLYASYLVTNQSVSSMVEKMANIGVSAYDTAEQMKKVVDIARESGVNAEKVSEKVLSNMDAINRFNFEGGVSGLAKMAAQASMLRIDMGRTLAFAEKVYSPEGAIETAAALQRLGVTQSALLDPLKMLDLSQNDPAELQNQVVEMTKSFVQLGESGRFEIMPGAKRQLQEIAKAMDIPYTEITKMALGSAELDKKMKEISFPSSIATEEDRKMIANMAEAKGGEYLVKVGEDTKKVSELSKEDFDKLKETYEKGPPTMEQLAGEQLSVTKTIDGNIAVLTSILAKTIARSDTASLAAAFTKQTFQELGNIGKKTDFQPKELSKLLDNAVLKGEVSLEGFMKGTMKNLSGVVDNISGAMDRLSKKFPIFEQFIDNVTKKVVTPTTQGGDVLKLPNETIQLLPEDTFAAFTKGKEVLSNLGNNNTKTISSTKSTMDLTHTLNVNITAPNHINTDQVIQMFKDSSVSQALGVAVKESFNNDGLTTPNPNKQQFLSQGVLQYS